MRNKERHIGLFLILLLSLSSVCAQNYCEDILNDAKNYLAQKELKNALNTLQQAEVCDTENEIMEKRQIVQNKIFEALENQKTEAENNLKKFESEKSAKDECLELKELTELQSKHSKGFTIWLEANDEVNKKSFELLEKLKDKEKVNDSLVSFYNNKCKLDSTNYYNWLRLYHAYTKTNKAPHTQLEVLDKILELKEDYSIAYAYKAWNYFQLKDYKKAILTFEKTIDLNPIYSNGYRNIGLAYSQLDDQVNAMINYNKAIEIDSANTWAYINRGDEYSKSKEYDKALQDFNKAIDLGLVKIDAYTARGHVYRNLGQYKNALSDYNKVIELDPTYHYAYNGMGIVYHYDMKDANKALVFYNKAIELDPNEPIYYNNRALAYERLSQVEEALLDYSKAIEVDSTYYSAYHALGNLFYIKKEYQNALSNYNKAIELNSNYTTAYSNKGLSYYKLGDYKNALLNYKKAIEIDSTYSSAYIGMGNVFYAKNDYQNALFNYNKVIGLDPENIDAYYNRGISYSNLGEYKKALLDLNQAIELDPKSTKYYQKRGLVYEELGEIEKAQMDYEKANELQQEPVKIDLRNPSLLFLQSETGEGLKLINEKWIAANSEKTEYISFLKPYLLEPTNQDLLNKINLLLKTPQAKKNEVKILPFYKDIFLHKLKNITSNNKEEFDMYVVADKFSNIRMILNGTSNPIHRMNDEFPIQLTNENVADYLDFFCTHVHGDQGSFQIISTIEDIIWKENSNSKEIEKLKKTLENTLNETKKEINFSEGSWYTERILFYGGSLFKAKLKVSGDGFLEMLEDKPLNIEIPAKALITIGSFYQFKEIDSE